MINQAAPEVCICLPTYNAEKTILGTLDSLLNQTYPNIGFIVVDNCSTDATVKIIESLCDPRISIIRNAFNLGGEGNFNRCIEVARGKYMGIYHADDVYEPTMVEEQVRFLEANPNASGVFTEAIVINESGVVVGSIKIPDELRAKAPLFSFSEIFKAVLKHSNFLICPSMMTSTNILQEKIGSWRGELFASSSDLDVWFRLLYVGPIGILPKKLLRYRISNTQGSAAVRLNTERADFFKVIDYYLSQLEGSFLATGADIKNYQRLQRRDSAMRSLNALIAGNKVMATSLCPSLLQFDVWSAALSGKRGLFVLILVIFIRIISLTNLEKQFSPILVWVKKVSGK